MHCNPSAETALKPLIWWLESLSGLSAQESFFFRGDLSCSHTHTHTIHTIHTLYTHTHTLYTHTIHTLYTHYTHTIHTLYTHYTHTIHTLYTHTHTHTTHTHTCTHSLLGRGQPGSRCSKGAPCRVDGVNVAWTGYRHTYSTRLAENAAITLLKLYSSEECPGTRRK